MPAWIIVDLQHGLTRHFRRRYTQRVPRSWLLRSNIVASHKLILAWGFCVTAPKHRLQKASLLHLQEKWFFDRLFGRLGFFTVRRYSNPSTIRELSKSLLSYLSLSVFTKEFAPKQVLCRKSYANLIQSDWNVARKCFDRCTTQLIGNNCNWWFIIVPTAWLCG